MPKEDSDDTDETFSTVNNSVLGPDASPAEKMKEAITNKLIGEVKRKKTKIAKEMENYNWRLFQLRNPVEQVEEKVTVRGGKR